MITLKTKHITQKLKTMKINYLIKKTTLFLISCIIITSCAMNNKNNQQLASKMLDSLFNDRYGVSKLESNNVLLPGGMVLIKKGDSVLYEKGFGIADIAKNTKIDSNTFFNIASVSKQFTAVAILKLHSCGKININNSIYDINETVSSYLPKRNKEFEKITIKHLMSHSSGIPDLRPRTDRNFVLTATDLESLTYMKDLTKLNFVPGSNYEYMNPTFQLLYVIIESVSGKTFEDYMREEIFNPAKMNNTVYFEAERIIPNMSHGYIALDENASNKEFKEYDYGQESFFATKADGGIYTSVEEFAKWEYALSKGLILDSTLLKEAYSPITKISGSKFSSYQNRNYTSYGYGWFVDQTPNCPEKIYHTGDNGGFQIYAAKYPSKDLIILVFENRNDNDRWQMAQKIDSIAIKAGWLK